LFNASSYFKDSKPLLDNLTRTTDTGPSGGMARPRGLQRSRTFAEAGPEDIIWPGPSMLAVPESGVELGAAAGPPMRESVSGLTVDTSMKWRPRVNNF